MSQWKTHSEYDIVERAAATLPQGAQSALFNVVGGRVLVYNIVGEVTTVIQTLANDTKIVANPTVGADTDLCAVADISAAAVGTAFSTLAAVATVLQITPSGGFLARNAPLCVMPGTIDLNCAASATGAVKWVLHYRPLDPGAYVTAA